MRGMVEHLAGREPGRGRPPQWVRDQSALGLKATRPGSLVAELVLMPTDDQPDLINHGPSAIEALLNWNQDGDTSFPRQVQERYEAISAALPESLSLFLGTPGDARRIRFTRSDPIAEPDPEPEEAYLSGWLKEVNWHNRTAQLHRMGDPYIKLRFGPDLDGEMLRLATQYVQIIGHGTFDKEENWKTVYVEEVKETRSWGEPFDIEAFWNDPNPKIFNPDDIVPLGLSDEEWEAFNQAIRRGREA